MPLSDPQLNPLVSPGQALRVFGNNPNVDSGSVPQSIWTQPGLVDFPTTADVVSIVSDDANDTAAGTGMQSVAMVGVDGDFNIIQEIVALDGLTPVLSTQEFLFINFAIIATAGALEINQGNITFTIGGSLCNGMAPLKGQAQTAAAVIPNALQTGTAAQLLRIAVAMGRVQNTLIGIEFHVRLPSGVQFTSIEFPVSQDGQFILDVSIPLTLIAGAQIDSRAVFSSANNVTVGTVLQISWLPV